MKIVNRENLIKIIPLLLIILLMIFYSINYSNFIIKTSSMSPEIEIGDMVVINKSITLNDLTEGDIIAFNVDINNDGNYNVVVHFIDEIIDTQTGLKFKTVPHVSNQPDDWLLDESHIIGKHVLSIRNFNKFILYFTSPVGLMLFIINLFLFLTIIKYIFKREP